ncbi:MBL fold metallo-hydrolase RNA specificity domain-containing protein, partial [Bacillus sp. B-TM1]
AATPIPGNERNVSRIIDNLFALGARVIYGSGSSTGVHVSGHAYQEELKLMLTLMKPKYFIPIHGEFRMLHHHSLLAESIGVEKENIFIVRNGVVFDHVIMHFQHHQFLIHLHIYFLLVFFSIELPLDYLYLQPL